MPVAQSVMSGFRSLVDARGFDALRQKCESSLVDYLWTISTFPQLCPKVLPI